MQYFKTLSGRRTTVLTAMEGMTFGADPEVFVVNEEGKPVFPDFVPGTKEEPYKVDGGALQRDGCAAEFNIDPVSDFKSFNANIEKVLGALKSKLPAGHKLCFKPTVTFDEKTWDAIPDEDKALGCSPDYDAWTVSVNPPPDGDAIPRMRSGAGHVHFGWTEGADITNLEHVKDATDLVKQLDWYLGPWSAREDKDKTRRKLYGKAGACRIKDYGVEYRVLSNFWVKDELTRIKLWNRMNAAINSMATTYFPEHSAEKYSNATFSFNDRVVKSINTGTRDEILEEFFRRPVISL